MHNILLWLHIATAVLIIGGLATTSMLLPGLIRGGAENVPALRHMHQFLKVYGPSATIVLVFGLALVFRSGSGFSFSQIWLGLSLALYIVAAVIGAGPEAKTTEAAIAKLEAGESADAEAKRVGMFSGINIVILFVIVYLMVDKPGFP